MEKIKLTPDDCAIANAAETSDENRPALTQVYIADGKIIACDRFILAYRTIDCKETHYIPADKIRNLRTFSIIKAGIKSVVIKIANKHGFFNKTEVHRREYELDAATAEGNAKNQLKLTETPDHQFSFAMRADVLKKALKCLPKEEDVQIMRFFVKNRSSAVKITCQGTTILAMPMMVQEKD